MSDILNTLFDPYDRKARLGPALLCGLPFVVSIVLLVPDLGALWATVGGILLYGGGATFLVQIGRDLGKALEPELFRSWGGKPSVAILRHSDPRLVAATKNRYRTFLERAVPDLTLASPEIEQRHPQAADDGYQSATDWLLTQTRGQERFALLFRENINYGFRRNVWALRPWAFGLEAITLAVIAAIALNSWTGDLRATIQTLSIAWWASLGAIVLHAFFFALKIRKAWVRLAAEAFAQQLLAACDVLEREWAD